MQRASSSGALKALGSDSGDSSHHHQSLEPRRQNGASNGSNGSNGGAALQGKHSHSPHLAMRGLTIIYYMCAPVSCAPAHKLDAS